VRKLVFGVMLFAVIARMAGAESSSFHWVNLESDKTTMAHVHAALKGQSYSAIREVGIDRDFALIMTSNREADALDPDYDQWTVYNLNLATGKLRQILSGYGLHMWGWGGKDASELQVTYYDCTECEAATIFTAFHQSSTGGWTARWPNKDGDKPGALIAVGDTGMSEDVDDEQQVFAVLSEVMGPLVAGYWYHYRDTKTGKLHDELTRYSVDPMTGKEQNEKLAGTKVAAFEKALCNASTWRTPNEGQDTPVCRMILRKTAAKTSPSK